jgi:hypothetical protein
MPPEQRVADYARERGIKLVVDEALPQGQGGLVRITDRRSIIKAPRARHLYEQEVAVYRYLLEEEIDAITLTSYEVISIPVLLGHDDALQVFEITRVRRPFLLDFAGARSDKRPDFDDEMWQLRLAELHPAERVQDALYVIQAMDEAGVFLTDLHAGNLSFPEYDTLPDDSSIRGLLFA